MKKGRLVADLHALLHVVVVIVAPHFAIFGVAVPNVPIMLVRISVAAVFAIVMRNDCSACEQSKCSKGKIATTLASLGSTHRSANKRSSHGCCNCDLCKLGHFVPSRFLYAGNLLSFDD